MTNNSYKEHFNVYKKLVEKKLDEFIEIKYPEEIFESMKYSVNAGGKRLRPVMAIEVCNMLGGTTEDVLPAACAIEMLHTQSLIHDDLPCMDNDDYRRGKLTNHKAFSESTAVLAGDALLSFAPQLIIEKSQLSADKILALIHEFCKAAGVDGIIAGQIVDIQSENKHITPETLHYLQEYKTSKLFVLAVKTGAIVAGASQKQVDELEEFAVKFGHAFQICDDILDEIATAQDLGKTPGKDANAHKSTYTSMFGLDKAKSDLRLLCEQCCDILNKNNFKSEILTGIVNDLVERVF